MARLLFDVTRLLQGGLHTGIQRVVRSLLAASQTHFGARHDVRAVSFDDHGCWQSYVRLAPHPLQSLGTYPPAGGEPIEPGAGDILLMFDASWYGEPWPAVDAALCRGARLYGMVHDLLPLERSEWFRSGLRQRFQLHLQAMSERAEGLFVPSAVVRDRVARTLGMPNGRIRVLAHGGDFCPSSLVGRLPKALHAFVAASDAPLFFVLGTLEPRKNHAQVLDAFERLWAEGRQARLLFVGSRGWEVDALLARIDRHPQAARQLLQVSGLDDAALLWLFRHAEALIYLSRDEGFGLPVLEAAMHGCPVICADIPVLREAGAAWPRYVAPQEAGELHAALLDPPTRHGQRPAPYRSWGQVAEQLGRFLRLESVTSPCTIED